MLENNELLLVRVGHLGTELVFVEEFQPFGGGARQSAVGDVIVVLSLVLIKSILKVLVIAIGSIIAVRDTIINMVQTV